MELQEIDYKNRRRRSRNQKPMWGDMTILQYQSDIHTSTDLATRYDKKRKGHKPVSLVRCPYCGRMLGQVCTLNEHVKASIECEKARYE